jgi:hypothetical protein
VVFGESKIQASKSRRRNIFDKSLNDNASRVSNSIADSSISGLDDTRRKSKSRLRDLFNSSREKEGREGSKDCKESTSNMITVGPLTLESKDIERSSFKPVAHANSRLVQLEQKVLENNDDFSLDESKSELNLSTSNNLGRG